MGGGINENGEGIQFIRKYDFEGNILNENILIDSDGEYVLGGIISSFHWNPYIQKFIYLHGVNLNNGTTEGYLIEFNQNLDTVFSKRYNQYTPYTYPFIFQVESDGYIVVGEYGGIMNSNGTFLMKLDFEGNIMWSEIMQPEVYEHIYRNLNILKMSYGYMISGWGRIAETDNNPFGLLTFTNSSGETENTIEMIDEEMPRSNGVLIIRSSLNEIILSQNFGYELVSETGNPNVFWNKIRLSKYNTATDSIYNSKDYFDDYEFFQGGANKLLATGDGGVIIVGAHAGYYFDYTSWVLKLDSDLNQEWFHEYTYQTCDNCSNILYDIELAPDGGYIAAGQFANYDIDPRNATWLLKIDACGDLEWQGCEAVGVAEQEAKAFSVYPNPNSGRFIVETAQNNHISAWSVTNLAGQKVAQGNAQGVGPSLQIHLNLPTGLYALELMQSDGKRENHKIQIVR